MIDIITSLDLDKQHKCALIVWATWSEPSHRMYKLFDKLSLEFLNVKFHSLEVDTSAELLSRLKINHVPTMMFYDDNLLIEKVVGPQLIKPLRSILLKLSKENNGN